MEEETKEIIEELKSIGINVLGGRCKKYAHHTRFSIFCSGDAEQIEKQIKDNFDPYNEYGKGYLFVERGKFRHGANVCVRC